SRLAGALLPSAMRAALCVRRFWSSLAKSDERGEPTSVAAEMPTRCASSALAKVIVASRSAIATLRRSDSTTRLKSSVAMGEKERRSAPSLVALRELVNHAQQVPGCGLERGLRALRRGKYPARDLLAELHAPLVEGIDPPDGGLREHLVLVKGDE